ARPSSRTTPRSRRWRTPASRSRRSERLARREAIATRMVQASAMGSPDAPGWDVMILNFDGHTPLAPASWRPRHGPRPMGSPETVRRDIDGTLADVDWSDPARGVLVDGDARLELDVGSAAVVDGFVVHTQRGRRAAGLIAHMCLVNGWAALDGATGAFL